MIINPTKLTIKGKDFMINEPNMGQLMQIESLKVTLSDGRYDEMVKSTLISVRFNADLVDACAYLMTLIPNLGKEIKAIGANTNSISDLDAMTAKELVSVYKNQFSPWFKPLADELYALPEESVKDQPKQ